mmetsp:Transcript_115713/g.226937  ORF Transcript_115713/g.226937 Transcript_115713/m.226937 type:complete len:218 (-) Transcript_115713:245-898(-)
MNSKAVRVSPSIRLAVPSITPTSLKDDSLANTTHEKEGLVANNTLTLVITPRVPSEPINRCLLCKPQLSLRKVRFISTIVPSARTTSNPKTFPCKLPYLITRNPPALVATLPPIMQEPFAARSSGNVNPFSPTCAFNHSSTHPASHVTTPALESMSMILFMRLVDRINSPLSVPTAPPTKPVLPPCGTTPILFSLQYFKTRDTSSVVLGKQTKLPPK